jgi:hypothetical protein
MRHLIEDDGNEMSGFGDIAEVHEGPDGKFYEWVEGLSAWGEPVGYWQGLSEVAVQPFAPDTALGALYQASDGSLYQLQGVAEGEPEASAEEAPDDDGGGEQPDKPVKMGPGRPGEIRVGPDGRRYRWVLGVGAGGKRTGFWKRLRPRPRGRAPQAQRSAAAGRRPGPRRPGQRPAGGRRQRKPFLKRLLPFAKAAASLIPIPGAGQLVKGGLTLADRAFTKKRVAGIAGLGALYQASDGSLYQLQGIDEDELNGAAATEPIEGYYAGAETDLDGLAQDEIAGIDESDQVDGWGDAIDSQIEGDDALDGYVREQPGNLQAYVPVKPAETRTFDATREPPDNWKPLW